MPSSAKKSASDDDLPSAVRDLRSAVADLRKALPRPVSSRWDIAMAFLKGVASVLGAIATVAILIPLTLWLLRGIAWPPLIGRWVGAIVDQVEQARRAN